MDEFITDGCTWFPDLWVGHCCVAHDYADYKGVPDSHADAALFECVIESTPAPYEFGAILAVVMLLGLILGRRLYRNIKGAGQ